MREIRKLAKEQIREVLEIVSRAYPTIDLSSEQKIEDFERRVLEGFDIISREWFGLFEDDVLLGNMVLYDFTINYYGKDIKGCGIGFVAVDFLHKKQKICRDMLQFYLKLSKERGYPLALLYSFRPDFYKKMGFGYGTSCFNYVTCPDRLPKTDKNYPFRYLRISDLELIKSFYGNLYKDNHGMIVKNPKEIETMLKTPGITVVGYEENGILLSLLSFSMHEIHGTNETSNMDLEMLFINSKGLKASLNFLRNQADQVSKIAFSTPFKSFYFNMEDIRHMDKRILREPGFHHTFDSGMGIMYRALDPVNLIINRPVEIDNIKIRFLLTDSFMPENETDFIICWNDNNPSLSKDSNYELELKMDISDFSSWIMNSIDISTMHQYGLVEISDETYLDTLIKAFFYKQQPICLQRF